MIHVSERLGAQCRAWVAKPAGTQPALHCCRWTHISALPALNRTATSSRTSQMGQTKRARTAPGSSALRVCADVQEQDSPLVVLPSELLLQVLSKLDPVSLANCARVKALRGVDKPSGLRLVDRAAMEAMVQRGDEARCNRWRHMSWLERLYVECSHVGFDRERCQKQGFQFLPPTQEHSKPIVKLQGMGPRLLVSDLSTFDQPYLRWRLCVRGNAAVEFGVVPVHMQDHQSVLHKTSAATAFGVRSVGVASMITVGSQLHNKVSLMKGSIVEVLARRGTLDVLVTNPPDGQELFWQNARTIPMPYTGPAECRLTLEFPPEHDVKLALTCWAHGAFDVLHPEARAVPALVPRLSKAPAAGQLVVPSGDGTVELRESSPCGLCCGTGCGVGCGPSGAWLGHGAQSSSGGERGSAEPGEAGVEMDSAARQGTAQRSRSSASPRSGGDNVAGKAGARRSGSLINMGHCRMGSERRQQARRSNMEKQHGRSGGEGAPGSSGGQAGSRSAANAAHDDASVTGVC